ncbi:MAG: ferrochelatase [Dokdonella sp.]
MTHVVLLVNLGTPDAPTTGAVRRYLAEFLGDRRVVDLPRWLWWPILYGVILMIRPARSARLYRAVWTERGSPLATGTADLARAVDEVMGDDVVVRHAMRYGNPGVAAVLEELKKTGLRKLLVIPLFPQYSATTSASVFDAVIKQLQGWRHVPDFAFLGDYHVDPAYIGALAKSVRSHWAEHGRADRLMLSFHGIPQRYVRKGDPYQAQCQATAAALREQLGIDENEFLVCYQSRVGREPWLTPYTDKTLEALPKEGVRSVQVLCPGFAIDCLETLEEVAITNREIFEHAGGERYEYIACLNDGDAQVQLFFDLIKRHACSGMQAMPDPDA